MGTHYRSRKSCWAWGEYGNTGVVGLSMTWVEQELHSRPYQFEFPQLLSPWPWNVVKVTKKWHEWTVHHKLATHIWHLWWTCHRSAPIPAVWSGRWCWPTMLTTSYNTNQATHTWHLWWTCRGCPGPAPIPAAWSGRWCRRSRRTAASPRCPCSSAEESWGTGRYNKLCQNRFHLPLHSLLPSPTSLPDHFSMDLHSVFNLDWAELDWSQWVHPLVKVFIKLQRTEGLKHKWYFVSDISGTEPAFTGACRWVLLPHIYQRTTCKLSKPAAWVILHIRDGAQGGCIVLSGSNYKGLNKK